MEKNNASLVVARCNHARCTEYTDVDLIIISPFTRGLRTPLHVVKPPGKYLLWPAVQCTNKVLNHKAAVPLNSNCAVLKEFYIINIKHTLDFCTKKIFSWLNVFVSTSLYNIYK